MKYFLNISLLLLVAVSFSFTPVQTVKAATSSSNNYENSQKKNTVKKSTRKKISYKKRVKIRKARLEKRRVALAKQRAFDLGESYDGSTMPKFASNSMLVVNQNTGEVKFSKNTKAQVPIASITKLMTAMVVLDAGLSLEEIISISDQDVDRVKRTRSRLPVGTSFSRDDMLKLALISSENRAAFALSRHYPGGREAFIRAMNAKALALGLMHTHFTDPTGLSPENKSTAEDLYQLISAAYQYPFIRETTTTPEYQVYIDGGSKPLKYKNTNVLVRKGEWDIGLSKTGFINEAGRCLVMQATVLDEPLMIVLLDSDGSNKRTGDAIRVRKRVEYEHLNPSPAVQVAQKNIEQKTVQQKNTAQVKTAPSKAERLKVAQNHEQAVAELSLKEEPAYTVTPVSAKSANAPKLMMTQTIYEERYDQWLLAQEQQ